MTQKVEFTVDGNRVSAQAGTSLAAALLNNGIYSTRTSIKGHDRGPVCGMGICYECRVMVKGENYVLACKTLCAQGMEVVTR